MWSVFMRQDIKVCCSIEARLHPDLDAPVIWWVGGWIDTAFRYRGCLDGLLKDEEDQNDIDVRWCLVG
jgi:hypothetical protein